LQEEIEKAKVAAFRLLSYRIRSCKEITDRLKGKGFSKSTINTVIRDLKRINYLNDYKFAKEFVESRLIHNPKGKKLLRYELLQKGVDNKIIDKVIGEKISAGDEENIARLLAEKVWKKKKNIEEIKRKAQTYNYLTRRGFPVSLVAKILEELKEL
jgi:regulatory protein